MHRIQNIFSVNVIWQVHICIAVKLRPKSIPYIRPIVIDVSNNFFFFSCDVARNVFPGLVLAVMKSMN